MKKRKSRSYYQRKFERELKQALKVSLEDAKNNDNLNNEKDVIIDSNNNNADEESNKDNEMVDKNNDSENEGKEDSSKDNITPNNKFDTILEPQSNQDTQSKQEEFLQQSIISQSKDENNESESSIDQNSNKEKILTEEEPIQTSISNDSKDYSIKQNTQLLTPILNSESSQNSKDSIKVDSNQNPLFVEFEIEAPTPKANTPNLFIKKKNSNPQFPLLIDSNYSSSTSSTTSSSSDDNDVSISSTKPQESLVSLLTYQKNEQQDQSNDKSNQSQVDNESNYFNNDDDISFDYNDVEIDEQDGNNAGDSNKIDSNLNPINSHQIQTNNKETIQNAKSKIQSQPLKNIIYYSDIEQAKRAQQINSAQNQQYLSNLQKRFAASKISDPKLISAFMFLDEYEKNKKNENKKSDTIELTRDGIPFYSIDSSSFNEMSANIYPMDPIKPSSKMNSAIDMMIGMSDELNIDGLGNTLGFRPGFETDMDNDFHISLDSNNNLDNSLFGNSQNSSNSFTFEIAPYLQGVRQEKQQINAENSVENNPGANENDGESHLLNNENYFEINENADIDRAKNGESFRFYQQNEDFETDDDYDVEPHNTNNRLNIDLPGEKSNPNREFESGSLSIKNEISFHSTVSNLEKPKSKKINVAAFEKVPFRPMNSEDVYSLMMNSMTYNEKLFLK